MIKWADWHVQPNPQMNLLQVTLNPDFYEVPEVNGLIVYTHVGKSLSNCLSPCLCISWIWVLHQFIVLVCVSNVIFKTYPYDCIYKHRWIFKNWKWLFFFGFGTITIVLSVSTIILIRVGYCWNFYLTMFWRYYGILLLLKF